MAAPVLAEKLEGKYEVRNLVGGIVAWYNAGGEVVDEGGCTGGGGSPGSAAVHRVRPAEAELGQASKGGKVAFLFGK